MESRLGEIARGLREVIDELRAAVVAVEDVFTHQNPRSALALAQARGMVLAVIGLCGLRVASYRAGDGEEIGDRRRCAPTRARSRAWCRR